jgi:hypothetical protein
LIALETEKVAGTSSPDRIGRDMKAKLLGGRIEWPPGEHDRNSLRTGRKYVRLEF